MDSEKRKALEKAGWRFGDSADFLEMTAGERQLLELRVEAALAVRRQRATSKLSQKQLASRIKTSQPRIVKIENAARDVSLDQILRAFAAIGGRIVVSHVNGSQSSERKKSGKRTRSIDAEIRIDLIGNEV